MLTESRQVELAMHDRRGRTPQEMAESYGQDAVIMATALTEEAWCSVDMVRLFARIAIHFAIIASKTRASYKGK